MDLTRSLSDLQAALQVKVCMLADQTEIILDLREKLAEVSQDRDQLQDSLVEMENLLDSSERERKDAADNLEWNFQREMQLNTKIKSLESTNSKLRRALEVESEDSSNSDSENEVDEEEVGGEEGDYREEKAESIKESHVVAKHDAPSAIKKGKIRDGDLGIADVVYREDCRTSSSTSHPPKLMKKALSSSSPSSLRKQLRLSSRKELKVWIVQLSDEQHRLKHSTEVEKKAKAELVKEFQVTIEEQKAEILHCASAAKESVGKLEDTARKLLCKENENIRIAHSVVRCLFTCPSNPTYLIFLLLFYTISTLLIIFFFLYLSSSFRHSHPFS